MANRNISLDQLPLLLRPTEIAELLGVARSVAYELVNTELPRVYIGRSVRVPSADLLAWIERNKRGGKPAA